MSSISADADQDIDHHLANRIRGLRQSRALTLEALAARSDVSRAMLSRIERGESSPTAQLLNRICGGLGVTLSTLFVDAAARPDPISRRDAQAMWRDPASRYLRRHVSPATASSVDIVEVEFPPGGNVAFDSQRLAGMEQQVWVLHGTLVLQLGDETVRLEQGDCMAMGFDRPIGFHNPTQHAIRYAVIIGRTR